VKEAAAIARPKMLKKEAVSFGLVQGGGDRPKEYKLVLDFPTPVTNNILLCNIEF